MNQSPDDKCSNQVKPGYEIRMGREIPIIKKASGCDSEKDTNCADKQADLREDRASSLV